MVGGAVEGIEMVEGLLFGLAGWRGGGHPSAQGARGRHRQVELPAGLTAPSTLKVLRTLHHCRVTHPTQLARPTSLQAWRAAWL